MNQYEYIHRVCPHCDSKKLVPSIFVKDVRIFRATDSQTMLHAEHFYCEKCHRVLTYEDTKWKLDRLQIRRDRVKLRRYLEKGLPRCYR